MSEFTQPLELKKAAAETATPLTGERTDARARTGCCRASELTLVVLFLLVIASVPVGQTCLELARGERVQFLDVFRQWPTAQRLRQYEGVLKEKSWFQQTLRPLVQRLLFMTLADTGAKGVLGRGQWLFYRTDLRYVVEPDRPDLGDTRTKWVPTYDNRTERENVTQAIVKFRDQLRERGIALLVLPVPGKPSVYPGQLTSRRAAEVSVLPSPTLRLINMLQSNQVQVMDLFSIFAEDLAKGTNPLYLAQDTHWTPAGVLLAAGALAARLREAGLAPPPSRQFRTETVDVQRWGDVLEMMQIPGLRRVFPAQTVRCEQVVDPGVGLLVPTPSNRPGAYRFPGQKASILVLGDSFLRIYQFPEPRSLGELPRGTSPADAQDANTKKLLPGSAGFVSQLALLLQAPVDAIYSDGGASTDVRRKLSTNPEILEGKKVVIWEFVERDVALGREGWEETPLPAKLD